ncbi:MAG: cell division protein ZipA C-terminal FtsZ-binding domain-containing protein [Pseudomonadota bacterium]|nr:MAG: cell division protein ZipA C-terminal FtsZ-binding domain-containing protein [Pseudomonadota bacterium]
MNLQLALLVIGILIILFIAASALGKADWRKWLAGWRGRTRVEVAPPSARFGANLPASARPTSARRLDINPPPPHDRGAKIIKIDPSLTPPETAATADPIAAELEVLEDVASMPLDLHTPGEPRRRRRGPARAVAPDETVDFVLYLIDGEPVPRDAALGVFRQHEYLLEKRRRLYGKNLDAGVWSELQEDSHRTSYSDLALAIQLADAEGPIDESELNRFSQIGLRLADALQRKTRFSLSFEGALARAKELDQFAKTYDVIASVNLTAAPGKAFQGREIDIGARQLGMQFGAMNIFHKKNNMSPGCRHLFSLANRFQPGEFDPSKWDHFNTTGLTFFMNVPCAHRPASVFETMVAAARELGSVVGGHLTDQEDRPLTEKGAAVIRAQIQQIDDKMRAFGVVPGSETALRLFGNADL